MRGASPGATKWMPKRKEPTVGEICVRLRSGIAQMELYERTRSAVNEFRALPEFYW